ncbi:unnamed protein product [Prunus armeniaca]
MVFYRKKQQTNSGVDQNLEEKGSKAILHLPQEQGCHTGTSRDQFCQKREKSRNSFSDRTNNLSATKADKSRISWQTFYPSCLIHSQATQTFTNARAVEGQENTLEGDVFSQESFECRLAEVEEAPEQQTPIAKIGGTATKLAADQPNGQSPQAPIHNSKLWRDSYSQGDGRWRSAISLLPHRFCHLGIRLKCVRSAPNMRFHQENQKHLQDLYT